MSDEIVSKSLSVNGESRTVAFPVHQTLLEVLREDLGLTGTKHGCELGECGTCTVLVDGEPVLSCLALAAECEGRAIETVEGLARGHRAPPAAGGVRRPRRRPVRLLHAGHPDDRQGAAGRRTRDPSRRRSARRSPATSAAAPATSRSSKRSKERRPGCAARAGRREPGIALRRAGAEYPAGQALTPSRRAGRKKSPFRNASTPPTAKPRILNGSSTSQTSG